jgi:hypothetical protein
MSNNNYTLEIISHHPQFSNKSLRKYHIEGIDTVGAWGNEPFEIRFKNNTWQKIQVKLSVDGTDVFTGQPATTETDSKMWVVNGYGTLSLKAWPESMQGGAAFVFTNTANGVATHTHGDLSSQGIIAAAIFVEGQTYQLTYTYPITITLPYYNTHDWTYNPYPLYYNTVSGDIGGSYSSSSILNIPQSANNSLQFNNCNYVAPLQSDAAIGAGQYTEQSISHVAGLIKPTFAETVRVRYMWFDEMVAKLRQNNVPSPQPSGFPGDKEQGINLGTTPRLGHLKTATPAPVVYSRV